MSDATPALDEALERMAAASFELPNGFVNHGAMACEALAMLDCAGDIDSWARRFAQAGGASVDPVAPAGFEWRQALGDYQRLPEWIGYFTRAIDAVDTPPRRAGPGAGLLGGPLPRRPARWPPPATCGWRWCGQSPDSRPDLGTCDAGDRGAQVLRFCELMRAA